MTKKTGLIIKMSTERTSLRCRQLRTRSPDSFHSVRPQFRCLGFWLFKTLAFRFSICYSQIVSLQRVFHMVVLGSTELRSVSHGALAKIRKKKPTQAG